MKIAVISDIHANIYALMTVLEDIDSERVDTIVCLGDLV
ncbi:MAG: metallophosphoesterase family protein, partial [Clostridium sp.]|nr:metallophosphoesterase family protein [Clostridium sp.]